MCVESGADPVGIVGGKRDRESRPVARIVGFLGKKPRIVRPDLRHGPVVGPILNTVAKVCSNGNGVRGHRGCQRCPISQDFIEKFRCVCLAGCPDCGRFDHTVRPDEDLLKTTRGWLDPPPLEVSTGATGGRYDPEQRGYVLETDGAGPVVLKIKGEEGDTVDPVFILEGFAKKSVSVSINGKTLYADEFRWAVESEWTGDTGVLWIAVEIPPDAEIRIE